MLLGLLEQLWERGARAARIKTKAGLGFEATIAPNTTSGLADEGREGGMYNIIFTKGLDNLVLISVSMSAGS